MQAKSIKAGIANPFPAGDMEVKEFAPNWAKQAILHFSCFSARLRGFMFTQGGDVTLVQEVEEDSGEKEDEKVRAN